MLLITVLSLIGLFITLNSLRNFTSNKAIRRAVGWIRSS